MATCLCCSYTLLRHLRRTEVYWYCPHCRLEMPGVESSGQVMSLINDHTESSQVVSLNQWRPLLIAA